MMKNIGHDNSSQRRGFEREVMCIENGSDASMMDDIGGYKAGDEPAEEPGAGSNLENRPSSIG